VLLRSLTLRGFKSFPERTTLEFEPGCTVIVGPNGSGKSNLVDAVSWVLGAASPKSLRGGQMADVIFAGAPDRKGLGRAEVALTIDNGDGSLPVEFSEVTISRAIYATGDNEYAINGEACRALDVAELLGSAGLGRQTHTVVGQGQLDQILQGRPEDRRALVDEAAGILTHRKRKERALRKLERVDEHTERVNDTLRELRRQMRPLERQAEAAQQHAELTAQLTAVRRAKAARELDRLTADLAACESGSADRQEALAGARERHAAARAERERLDEVLGALAPRLREADQTHFALANLAERLDGAVDRVGERRRGLEAADEEPVVGRDPEALRAEAAHERGEREQRAQEHAEAEAALSQASEARAEAERARRAHEQAAAAEARRRAAEREARLRWEGEVTALRQAVAQSAGEEGRLDSQLSGWQDRAEELDADIAAVNAEIQRLDASTAELTERLRVAEQSVDRRQREADEAAHAERELERRRAGLEARADALRQAVAAGDAAGAVREAAAEGALEGLTATVAEHLSIAEGMGAAVAAALGPLGDALIADGSEAAARALAFVRRESLGRVRVLPAEATAMWPPAAPAGSRALIDAVEAPEGVRSALSRALGETYAVEDLTAARRLHEAHPEATFVTVAGEVVGPAGWSGGSGSVGEAVEAAAAAEAADREREAVEDELRLAHRRVGDADRALASARSELEAAQAAVSESDNQLTNAAERLGRLRKERQRATEALEQLDRQREELRADLAQRRARLEELETAGAPEPDEEDDSAGDPEAERLDDALAAARDAEVEARLTERTAADRLAECDRRIAALEAEADDVERQLAERRARQEARARAIARCEELAEVAVAARDRARASAREAQAQRDALDADRATTEQALGVARQHEQQAATALGELEEAQHADDLARERAAAALDAARRRVAHDLEEDPDALLAAAREAQGDDAPLASGADGDAELDAQEDQLTRRLARLGSVNPLAAEELAELTERDQFLSDQLEDLRSSRTDLLSLIQRVDDTIRQRFADAFDDVAAAFAELFPRLIGGGEGRLVLTDPDDLLETGIEVEARPPGKRVKRLTLLSGGERSITALAVLFAIFTARPSPFYVLDEVEAALDDVNLQRFLELVGEFRDTSQLLLVTHQKRTMEVADTLYGVSMQRGGVSKVISQRMGDAQAAAG